MKHSNRKSSTQLAAEILSNGWREESPNTIKLNSTSSRTRKARFHINGYSRGVLLGYMFEDDVQIIIDNSDKLRVTLRKRFPVIDDLGNNTICKKIEV